MNPYPIRRDAELVALLQQGDHVAFEAIYRRYVKTLYSYARRNVAVAEDCEEMVQDVFESLWARHRQLQIDSLKNYLLTAIRYKIIRYFKHQSVQRRYAEQFQLFEQAYTAGESEVADPDLLRESIIRQIAELPDRCQTAIRLRITENLSHREIADRMNITIKTVEMHMMRAFAHLRCSYDRIFKTG